MKQLLLSDLVHHKAEMLREKAALKIRNKQTGEWSPVSWKKFSEKIMDTAHALCDYGVKEFSNVGIYMQNMAECFYLDFALFANRAVAVPMYATSTVPQIEYIINEAQIEIIFVGEQFQYDNAYAALKKSNFLKKIVIVDNEVNKADDDTTSVYFEEFISKQKASEENKALVAKRRSEAQEEDITHILYTSGTTGEPKGVILHHSNYLEAFRIHDIRLGFLPKGFTSMSFLPLTHIFEKAWAFLCIYNDCTIAINLDPREIQDTIKEVRPEGMCCVPRFWEKVYAGVQEKIATSSPLLKKIFLDAIEIGRIHNLEYRNKEKRAPWRIRMKFNFYDKTIYKILKKVVGIENGLIFPCAGAALSDKINVFLQSVNIPLRYGYGLTETTATVSCFPQIDFEIGTVGKVMPGTEVKIGENSEILVKGKTVMHGYYKKPEETAKVFTEDGFFRTGDAGYLTEKDGIVLTERIKDLFKTSNGKYVAPQQIEMRLSEDKYIDMIATIGDQRKYVTALIVPAYEDLKAYAAQNGIEYKDMTDLCQNPQIYKMIETRIQDLQKDFANYEQIKKFTLLPESFTMTTGELTNTLKIKRQFITGKYKEIIDLMY